LGEKIANLSGYRPVWLFAMFDLPVDTKEARRTYARFRKALLADGFAMLQFSVYARYCGSEEASEMHRKRVGGCVPDDGQVRLVSVTDKQFEKMQVFFGRKRVAPEQPPAQMVFF